ncbi:unnamed protein product, partial [marine sediment metagenome]
ADDEITNTRPIPASRFPGFFKIRRTSNIIKIIRLP